MLYTKDYKRTLTICNTYCFCTAATVARTRLNATLYVHFLSFYTTQLMSAHQCDTLLEVLKDFLQSLR